LIRKGANPEGEWPSVEVEWCQAHVRQRALDVDVPRGLETAGEVRSSVSNGSKRRLVGCEGIGQERRPYFGRSGNGQVDVGEQKVVPSSRLLSDAVCSRLRSNEAVSPKSGAGERRRRRSAGLDATFRSSIPIGRRAEPKVTWNLFYFGAASLAERAPFSGPLAFQHFLR
jgi:hypothetical protein